MPEPDGVLRGIAECRAVGDRFGIEDREIGVRADAQPTLFFITGTIVSSRCAGISVILRSASISVSNFCSRTSGPNTRADVAELGGTNASCGIAWMMTSSPGFSR